VRDTSSRIRSFQVVSGLFLIMILILRFAYPSLMNDQRNLVFTGSIILCIGNIAWYYIGYRYWVSRIQGYMRKNHSKGWGFYSSELRSVLSGDSYADDAFIGRMRSHTSLYFTSFILSVLCLPILVFLMMP